MDEDLFNRTDPLIDLIAGQLTELMDSNAFAQVKQQLSDISREFGDDSITLEINLTVCDGENEHSLPLLQTGLSTSNGAAPYQCWGDSTPQRYVVHGDIVIVPHDRCPQCWGPWGFKLQNTACESCGTEMGRSVRLLLDSDCCPHCENGTVTAAAPKCTACGFQVNPDHVVWG